MEHGRWHWHPKMRRNLLDGKVTVMAVILEVLLMGIILFVIFLCGVAVCGLYLMIFGGHGVIGMLLVLAWWLVMMGILWIMQPRE